ncbi:ABC transporter substrate-binding protein [Devriesea agamarum]|uniref:ABC transporter substrate-binding protein n=1 Tax=Devriesea agamarum TaxID=472569 RepID=UPI00071D93D2|nr:ABC transporter substrate-binding protein [Devriesea agamarum]
MTPQDPRSGLSRRRVLMLGAVAVTVPALAACGSSKDKGAAPSADSGAREMQGTINNDGVLTIGTQVSTSNMFPENFNSYGGGETAAGTSLFFETLFRISSKNGMKLVPHLAEKVVYTDGGKVATYTLRKGVTWNDGKPFTSKDVAFTYDFVFGPPSPEKNAEGTYEFLKSPIETPDEYTVVLHYNEPQYAEDLPLSLYYPIFPEHIYKNVDRKSFIDKNPVGTGPGKLKSFANQEITITIRDDYWGEKTKGVKEVRLVPAGQAGNIQSQISDGKVDWAEGGAPGLLNSFVPRDPHNGYRYYPDGSTRGIIMAAHRLPCSDVAVRKALRASVDMNIVAKAGGIDYTVPSITGLDPVIYKDMLLPEYQKPLTPDVEQAKKELKDAGWTIENGNLVKDGKSYPLQLHISNDNAVEMATMPVVCDQWKKNLGLDIKFTPLPKEVYGPAQSKGDYDLGLWTTNAAGGAFQAFAMYRLTKFYQVGDEKADGNYGRWKTPEAVSNAILEMMNTPLEDTKKLAELCQIVQKAIADEAPYIPVQNNGAGGMYSTKKWSGLKKADEIDYFPRITGWNNIIGTVRDFEPSKK